MDENTNWTEPTGVQVVSAYEIGQAKLACAPKQRFVPTNVLLLKMIARTFFGRKVSPSLDDIAPSIFGVIVT